MSELLKIAAVGAVGYYLGMHHEQVSKWVKEKLDIQDEPPPTFKETPTQDSQSKAE